MENERLLKREEVAAILGLKPQTLAAWCCEGKGPPIVKLGGAVRYKQSDLKAFVESNVRGVTTK